MKYLLVVIAGLCLLFQGCINNSNEEESIKVRILENRNKWDKNEPETYGYILHDWCKCFSDSVRSFKIISTRDTLIKVNIIKNGPDSILDPRSNVRFSMDGIFEKIEANASSIKYLTYDSIFGFPEKINIDADRRSIDSKFSFEIMNFIANER